MENGLYIEIEINWTAFDWKKRRRRKLYDNFFFSRILRLCIVCAPFAIWRVIWNRFEREKERKKIGSPSPAGHLKNVCTNFYMLRTNYETIDANNSRPAGEWKLIKIEPKMLMKESDLTIFVVSATTFSIGLKILDWSCNYTGIFFL